MIRRFTFLAVVLALGLAASAQTRPAEPASPSRRYGGYGGYGGMEGDMGGYGQSQNVDRAYRELSLRWFPDGPVPDLNALSEQLRKQIPIDAAKELKLGDKVVERLENAVKGEPFDAFVAVIEPKESSWTIKLTLMFRAADNVPVQRLMDAIVARLRKEAVVSADQQMRTRLDQLGRRQNTLTEDVANLSARAAAITDRLRDTTGRLAVSPDVLRAAMAKLDDERQTLDIDKEDQAARLAALRESIAAQSEKLKEQIRNDAVSGELEKVVQAREEAAKLIEARYKMGTAAPGETQSAIGALAEARARLAERRDALATTGPGQLLAAWNKELLNLSIEMRQKAARLSAVEASLKKLQAAAPLLDELQRIQTKRDDDKKQLDDLASQIQSVEKEDRHLPVLITTQQ